MAWKLRKDKLKSDTPDADTPEAEPSAPETAPQAVLAPPPPAPADEPQFTDEVKPIFPTRPAAPTPALSDEDHFAAPEPGAPEEPQFSDSPEFPEPSPVAAGSDDLIPLPAAEPEPISLGTSEPEPIVLDTIEPEPISLGTSEPEPISLGAFTPYQPPEPIAPLEPMAPLEPIAAPAPAEPEFEEPSFDTPQPDPIALAPDPPVHEPEPAPALATPPPPEEAPSPAPNFEREALAPGLVTTDTESGLPRVAPFVLDAPVPEAPTTNAMPSVVLRLGNLSATYFLVKDVTTIGRPDSAVQNYPDIEVELDDGVSRHHAEIRKNGDVFALTDVGSTNGTILNGQMLTPNQPATLSHGDRIRIGERTEILFE